MINNDLFEFKTSDITTSKKVILDRRVRKNVSNFRHQASLLILSIIILIAAMLGCNSSKQSPAPIPSALPQDSFSQQHWYTDGTVAPSALLFDFPKPSENALVNYYAIPTAIRSRLSIADCQAYVSIVNAFLNYETSISYSDDSKIVNLFELIELCFPVFYADVLDSSIKCEQGRISWEYTLSEQEHYKAIATFEQRISEYLKLAIEGEASKASEIMRILILYKSFCDNINYDDPSQDHFTGKITLSESEYMDHNYDALVFGRGVCWCYARGYAFLLNQIGIEALTVCGEGGIGHHEWTMFKYDGSWFFADPTWDLGGMSLSYFGMTAKAREADNYLVKDMQYFAGAAYPLNEDFQVNDNRFVKIYSGALDHSSYELDIKDNKIIFYKSTLLGEFISGEFDLNFN